MKRMITVLFVVLTVSALFCACKNKGEEKRLANVYSSIREQVHLSDMNDFQDVASLERYYGITAEEVVDFAGGINYSGVDQEEIVMVQASNEQAAEHIQTTLDNRRQSKYNENKNYHPDQVGMINRSRVDRNGMYISLFLSDNADQIREIYNTLLEF